MCTLYEIQSGEDSEGEGEYVGRHIITRLLGILGVHNDIKKKIKWGTEMCIIWMF